MQILLCTNGFETTRPALTYGMWLAEKLRNPVTLLGILEDPEDQNQLEILIDETAQSLKNKKIQFQTLLREGRASIEISKQAQGGDYLTIVGPFGRPALRRWVRGRTFRRLLARLATPLLYVPEANLTMEHVLVCMGGLGFASSMEAVILYLAKATGAKLTLLNVVEPLSLDYPIAREVHQHLQDLPETDTPQGRNLKKGLERAQQAGLEAEVKVRHGNIIKEIMEELHSNNYDLVGLGSSYSAHGLRHLYLPNVTAEVAEAVNHPVLTVRADYKLVVENH